MNLKQGDKAYYDSFAGLIPCKVLNIGRRVTFKLTAHRGPYRRGEILDSSPTWIIPRAAVHVVCGQYRIRNLNEVQP